MVNQSLRWLNEDGAILWRGYHRGEEVANVWPGELVGNKIAEWQWRLTERPVGGSVVGTGEDQADLVHAQNAAKEAYFAA